MNDDFLRQQAVTQHFSLGAPRSFTLSNDGKKVFFVRSKGATDARGCLWMINLHEENPTEQLLVDVTKLSDTTDVPEAERRRRERAREAAGGIVSYSIDTSGTKAAFALAGDIYITTPRGAELVVAGQGAYDPRLSPDGHSIAYVAESSLHIVEARPGASPQTIASDDGEEVSWGVADFVVAEEMGRMRGFWWSADSQKLIVSWVDVNPVKEWYISQPASPEAAPQKIRYPAAGTPNARVGLTIIDEQGNKVPVQWDDQQFEYLVDVLWEQDEPIVTVQSRDQRTAQMLRVDPATGTTTVVRELTDTHWIELGSPPLQLADGRLMVMEDHGGKRRICSDGKPLTPNSLIVRAVHGCLSNGEVIFSAYQGDPKSWHVWAQPIDGEPVKVTSGRAIYGAVIGGATLVLKTQSMQSVGASTEILRYQDGRWRKAMTIANHAAVPSLQPKVAFAKSRRRQLETALILPEDHDGVVKLPVLVDPYGGPGAQKVLYALAAYTDAQWWANQGFAVVITDNRGTPGRGPAWEKEIAGDLIGPVLEDQIEALRDLGATHDYLDLSRVGIKGWSFGGYLAAYAVVRYPEIFHAAIAGAPVTDWRLYDTHYTERYLGDPQQNQAAYDACSLIKEAGKLSRPLLLIHGLADDNVVVAHSLQFSEALLAAGRLHQVLPLSGVTHMASQAVVAENIEKLQLDFLQSHLVSN